MNAFLWCVIGLHGFSALANLWALTEASAVARDARAFNGIINTSVAMWAASLL